jgi:hypothetical protein
VYGGLGILGLAGEDEQVAEAQVAGDGIGLAPAQADALDRLEGRHRHDVDGQSGRHHLAGQPGDGDLVLVDAQGPGHLAPVEVLAHEDRRVLNQAVGPAIVLVAHDDLVVARLQLPGEALRRRGHAAEPIEGEGGAEHRVAAEGDLGRGREDPQAGASGPGLPRRHDEGRLPRAHLHGQPLHELRRHAAPVGEQVQPAAPEGLVGKDVDEQVLEIHARGSSLARAF